VAIQPQSVVQIDLKMGFKFLKQILAILILVISGFLIACTSGTSGKLKVAFTAADTCKADRIKGRILGDKLSCTNCHFAWDEATRLREDILLLREISLMDSVKLSSYIFKTRHNGMFSKDFPDAKNTVDSLSDCDQKNLIHYLKDHNREHVYASEP